MGVSIQMRNTKGVTVRNCIFSNNHNNELPNHHQSNSNVTTSLNELNLLGIPSGGISMYSEESISLEVDNCTFVNNSANHNNLPYVIRPLQNKPAGHGGAIYLRLPKVTLSNVTIHNCYFESNVAEINGGAILFSLINASKNAFSIRNCTFANNSVSVTSGGALAIELSSSTDDNTFTVENCDFNCNHAIGGGALSVVLYDFRNNREADKEESMGHITLRNNSFVGNHAIREGSALGLFSFYHSGQFPYDVELEDW